MASSYKATKTELIAIYRLEFYKKKKNWKLCHDVRRDPPRSPSPKPVSQPLNKTYSVELDIEPKTDLEQISPHNKAFLHEEPGEFTQFSEDCLVGDNGYSASTEEILDQKKQLDDEPDIRAPPDPEPVQQQCQHTWAEQQQWLEDKSEALWQDAQQEWCGAEAEAVSEDIAYPDECDGPSHQRQRLWSPVNQYDQIKTQRELIKQQLEYFSPAELFQTAEEWLQKNGYPTLQEEYTPYYDQYGLVDDSTDFVRGAHRAPHSSETDLSVSHDECGCMSSRPLYVLTCRQLSEAMRRHATALRQLLIEQAIRDKLLPRAGWSPPLPADEFPTRDTDPGGAGASGDEPGAGGGELGAAGRGRGRLLRGEPLIGIGMGRPYRL